MEVTGVIQTMSWNVPAGTATKSVVKIQTQEQHPQVYEVDFFGDKQNLISNFRQNEVVTIGINLRGREWTSPQGEVKVFLSLNGWKINAAQQQPQQGQPMQPQQAYGQPQQQQGYPQQQQGYPPTTANARTTATNAAGSTDAGVCTATARATATNVLSGY